jgi:threonine synthase
LFVGLWLGVKELKLKAKVIGAAPKGANAFVPAFKQKNDELILTEYDSEYKCEKLIAPYSAMLPFTNIAQEEGHIILEFTHEELADAMQKVKQVGLKCEPSAAAAFAVLPQLFNMCKNKKNRIVYNEIVVINTGSGIMN